MSIPYTYYIKHLSSGLQYYGVKYGKKADPKTFWKENGYFTSSKIIRAILKSEGPKAFYAEVRKIFALKKEAIDYEQRFLHKVNAPSSMLWFNQAYGTGPYLDKFGTRNTNKGVPKTEEHRKKISEAHKGKKKPRSQAWTAKIAAANTGKVAWNKGVSPSEESRKKMSESRKGKTRGPMSDETKRKISEARKGRIVSEETIRKQVESRTGQKRTVEQKKRISDSLKGHTKSEEHRNKISLSKIGKKLPQRSPEHSKKISEAHQRRKLLRLSENNEKPVDETLDKQKIGL